MPTETDTGTHYLTEGVIKHTNSNWSKLAPSAEDHLEGEGWTCPFLACRAPSQECYKGAAATFQWVMVFQHIRDRLFQNRSRRAVIEKQKGEGKKKIIIWIISKLFNPAKKWKTSAGCPLYVNRAGCLS